VKGGIHKGKPHIHVVAALAKETEVTREELDRLFPTVVRTAPVGATSTDETMFVAQSEGQQESATSTAINEPAVEAIKQPDSTNTVLDEDEDGDATIDDPAESNATATRLSRHEVAQKLGMAKATPHAQTTAGADAGVMASGIDKELSDAQAGYQAAKKQLDLAKQEVIVTSKRLEIAQDRHLKLYPPQSTAEAAKAVIAAQNQAHQERAAKPPEPKLPLSPLDQAHQPRREFGLSRPTYGRPPVTPST